MAAVFPNRAGDHPGNDEILLEELRRAGIPTLEESCGKPQGTYADLIRNQSGEVKTGIEGHLHGWTFKRAWYYWVVKGPGLSIDDAMMLWRKRGKEIRANGDCACRSPFTWNKGFATRDYHIDTQEGLRIFADYIKEVYARELAKFGESA